MNLGSLLPIFQTYQKRTMWLLQCFSIHHNISSHLEAYESYVALIWTSTNHDRWGLCRSCICLQYHQWIFCNVLQILFVSQHYLINFNSNRLSYQWSLCSHLLKDLLCWKVFLHSLKLLCRCDPFSEVGIIVIVVLVLLPLFFGVCYYWFSATFEDAEIKIILGLHNK
jgi:hypothetical protein